MSSVESGAEQLVDQVHPARRSLTDQPMPIHCTNIRRRTAAAMGMLSILLAACSGPFDLDESGGVASNTETSRAGTAADAGLASLPVPRRIAVLRNIVPEQLRVEVLLGGRLVPIVRQEQADGEFTYSGRFRLRNPQGEQLEVRWIESFDEQDLQLATLTPRIIRDSDDREIRIGDDDYNYAHDADGDNFTNIVERRRASEGFHPFEPNGDGTTQEDPCEPVAASTDDRGFRIGVPRQICDLELIEVNNLVPLVRYYDTPDSSSNTDDLLEVELATSNGRVFTGDLESPAGATFVRVFWFERLAVGDRLRLTLSEPLAIGEFADRAIDDLQLEYDYNATDADRDGRNNFRERVTGTDPRAADERFVYNNTQTTCAVPRFPRAATGDNEVSLLGAVRGFVELSSGAAQSLSLASDADTRFHFAALDVQALGTLRVEHSAGAPNQSVIQVFQRDNQGRFDEVDRTRGSPRAVLEIDDLTAGGYCLLLTAPLSQQRVPAFGESDDGVANTQLEIELR